MTMNKIEQFDIDSTFVLRKLRRLVEENFSRMSLSREIVVKEQKYCIERPY